MDKVNLADEMLLLLQNLGEVRAQKKILHLVHGANLILRYLNQNSNKDVTPGDISLELNVSTARVATALKNLEDKGFVSRKDDPSDKRKILVKLTNNGRLEINDQVKKTKQLITDMFDYIGYDDTSEFLRIANKMFEYKLNETKQEDLKDD